MTRKVLWAVLAIGVALVIVPFGGLLAMQANVDNFRQVNNLPDFRLFTWFFVVPGVLLVLLAGYGLSGPQLTAKVHTHHARPTPA